MTTTVDTTTGEIIETASSKRRANSRSRQHADALMQAHIALMEHEVITTQQKPALYRLVNNQYADLQRWHDAHTGWRIRRAASVIRLVRQPSNFIQGYVIDKLQKPRDFACFAWVLWYAESRQMVGLGSNQQFLMSQMADQLEEQSATGNLAPHVAPLNFTRQDDRYSLKRALEALEGLGGLQLVDGSSDEWVNRSGVGEALWEFTEVTRSLMIALENEQVNVAGNELDGNPRTLKPARLPYTDQLDPLLRAWRILLLGPTLLRYDDLEAFEILKTNKVKVETELAETFGWLLDLRLEYAAIVRPLGNTGVPISLLNLGGAADQAALLCCEQIRRKVKSREWPAPDADGCILVAESELADILQKIRDRYGHNWGATAGKALFDFLKQDIFAKMRQAGLIRGPDRYKNVLILPTAARYAVSYGEPDEDDIIETVIETSQQQMNLESPTAKPTQKAEKVEKVEKKIGYTVKEFAQAFEVTNDVILKWIRNGNIQGAEKQGSAWNIPAKELRRLKKARES